MGNTKHTPGPWRLTAIPAGNSATIMVSGSAGYDLVDATGNDAPTNMADARLIAAAPELAEALLGLLADAIGCDLQEGPNAGSVIAARAALAKAGLL